MVEDLLRDFINAPWVKQLDFSTLEKVNSEYISDKKLKKTGILHFPIYTLKGMSLYSSPILY
jgi:hypothetical protein